MVISQPAMVGLEQARERIKRSVASVWERTRSWLASPPVPAVVAGDDASSSATDDAGPAFSFDDERGKPAAIEASAPAAGVPLTATERRARAAAVRGLLLARKRCYQAAEAAFAEAAALDPSLDLAGVPSFWQLHRAGQETAVRAYEAVGRVRDGAMLAATLRHTYRPRALPRPSATATAEG